jgi:hypothetical protein
VEAVDPLVVVALAVPTVQLVVFLDVVQVHAQGVYVTLCLPAQVAKFGTASVVKMKILFVL